MLYKSDFENHLMWINACFLATFTNALMAWDNGMGYNEYVLRDDIVYEETEVWSEEGLMEVEIIAYPHR